MNNDRNADHPTILEASRPEGAQAAAETSSLRCYFRKGTETTWGWGVTNGNAWFTMSGTWSKTPYTKLEKFFTAATLADMNTAAENALRYYKLVGYTLVGFFAATQAIGYDYPIVSNGTELYPTL
jgi:hypothetical protein